MSIEDNTLLAVAIARNVALGLLERSQFTDDAIWWMQGRGELPIDAFAEKVLAFTATQLTGEGRMDIHGITAEEDRVAVEAECFVPLKSGSIYNSTYHFLMKFRDGKAFLVKEYFDTLCARDAFRSSE
ncbi:MAG TPA: nuclear transport factor 2 family protein [Sphingobium sp.]|uniref:nuclear transport factor 2 family protein n=1 Tax=Sphingobium sp. TaxID=1912891 RepID=UPI002ED53AC6